jgi:hypothetical protein
MRRETVGRQNALLEDLPHVFVVGLMSEGSSGEQSSTGELENIGRQPCIPGPLKIHLTFIRTFQGARSR